MKYSEALREINELGKSGINLGLDRIKKLLDNMGNPEKHLKFIHIAGTNGKGSTLAMLSNILIHSGYTTGLFMSPYVLCFREMMQINGQIISEDELAECAEFVFGHAQNSAVNNEYPTQFEVITAIAFEWFKRQSCDFVCLEVGLGGRFDSTNIIPAPIMQIITSISMDHTSVLGGTIEKIAAEKAGIIKGGITVMYPLQADGVTAVIQKQCEMTGSKLIQPDLQYLKIEDIGWRKSKFISEDVTYHKSLLGEFQVYNCVTVITAARELKNQGLSIGEDDIRYGIENTFLPARMEVLSQKPLIILDGSHNPDGAKALEQLLKDLSGVPVTMIMGVLADKDFKAILEIVGKYAENFIAVTPDNPRALNCRELCNQAEKFCKEVSYCENLPDAVTSAIEKAGKNGILVVCGSLYLAADIRPLIVSNNSIRK